MTRFGDLLDFWQLFNLPKSPTFLGKFCKVVKIYHFSTEIIFRQLLQTFGDFFLVILVPRLKSSCVFSNWANLVLLFVFLIQLTVDGSDRSNNWPTTPAQELNVHLGDKLRCRTVRRRERERERESLERERCRRRLKCLCLEYFSFTFKTCKRISQKNVKFFAPQKKMFSLHIPTSKCFKFKVYFCTRALVPTMGHQSS